MPKLGDKKTQGLLLGFLNKTTRRGSFATPSKIYSAGEGHALQTKVS